MDEDWHPTLMTQEAAGAGELAQYTMDVSVWLYMDRTSMDVCVVIVWWRRKC